MTVNGTTTPTHLEGPDPRRWISLAIVVTAVLIVAMDNTILNVSLPSIQRDLDSTLSSVQWVVTGYSLTFATLLIIGGRLGDIYGPRRTFIVGVFSVACRVNSANSQRQQGAAQETKAGH